MITHFPFIMGGSYWMNNREKNIFTIIKFIIKTRISYSYWVFKYRNLMRMITYFKTNLNQTTTNANHATYLQLQSKFVFVWRRRHYLKSRQKVTGQWRQVPNTHHLTERRSNEGRYRIPTTSQRDWHNQDCRRYRESCASTQGCASYNECGTKLVYRE